MSTPTQQLRKLSLSQGPMPTTRSQVLAQSDVKEEADQSDHESSEDESSDDGQVSSRSIIEGQSGRKYINSAMSADAWKRAKDGLRGDFEVQYCMEFPSEPQTYFAFRIIPSEAQFGVRIGAPGTPYELPTCSCQDFQERHAACKHIYWLSDQLTATSAKEPQAEPIALRDVAQVADENSPFQHLTARGLQSVSRLLGWRYRPQSSRDVDELAFSRKDQVRDILSTFDVDGALPDEYLTDVYEDVSAESVQSDESMSSDSLEAVIFRLAAADEGVFRPLREAVDNDHCSSVYFGKMMERANRVFIRLEGIANHTGGKSPDVSSCARYLRQLVNSIRKNLEIRAPLGRVVQGKALHLLIMILDKVCRYNVDSYENYGPPPASPEDKLSRNLYQILVGVASSSKRNDPPSPKFNDRDKGHFIIDALWDLRPVARDYVNMLEGTLENIVNNGAPAEYIAELSRFVEQSAVGDEALGGASRAPKRPGASPELSQMKRMK
ncbi:MAG: hypothetical protein M1825_004728 [Sarcosagium campestre]|nr:MAG: hypothetical protein M1825_004728 [Sarcosagium campestre]